MKKWEQITVIVFFMLTFFALHPYVFVSHNDNLPDALVQI